MDGEALWVTVHGVAKSRTRLSDFSFTFQEFLRLNFPFDSEKRQVLILHQCMFDSKIFMSLLQPYEIIDKPIKTDLTLSKFKTLQRALQAQVL